MFIMEFIGVVPPQFRLIIFRILGKLAGGTRLIALLPGIYRLWAKVRAPVVRDWALRHERPYLFAGFGRGSLDAVECAMVQDDFARADGEFT